ncbi:hypothetical protein ACM37_00545 [Helicobacter pylori]|nr:hypothetical protein ACM37_00545 [Helicobacter pylori]
MNAMQTGALIGGGVSLITNIYECVVNGKDPKKAIEHTTIATLLISSGAMAVAGQVLIPIPVVGALIGGFVGAVLSETCFNALLKAREEAKLARQRRIEIEKECREIIKLLEAYQNQFKEVFEQYFHETTKFFNQSFDELERALYAGDTDLAISVNNKIQERLGQKALFDNSKEGWELITSNKNIRM